MRAAQAAAASKESSASAFAVWMQSKSGVDLARECMALVPVTLAPATPAAANAAGARPPAAAAAPTSAAAGGGGGGSMGRAGIPVPPARAPTPDEVELWRAVGHACKAVDVTLRCEAADGACVCVCVCVCVWRTSLYHPPRPPRLLPPPPQPTGSAGPLPSSHARTAPVRGTHSCRHQMRTAEE
jgi:hypothetical protein